jgi:hypothetical protein
MRHTLGPLALTLAALLAPEVGLGLAIDGGVDVARPSPPGEPGASDRTGGEQGQAAHAGPGSGDGGRAQADGGSLGPIYRMVTGSITTVDREKARLAIEETGKPVEVAYDRNTAVFLERHVGTMLGTVRDIVPGAQVRASVDKGGLASWIEVHLPPREATSTPVRPVSGQPGPATTAPPR